MIDPDEIPVIGRLRAYVDENEPEWYERGQYLQKAHCTRRLDHLEAVAIAVPDRLYRLWISAGVSLAGIFVASWLVILPLLAGWGVYESLQYAVSLEWLALFQIPDPEPLSLSESLAELARVIMTIVVLYVLWLAVFAILLPGIAMHEFGHVVAAVRNGYKIESYGLVLFGPLPMGAFVKPSDEGRPPYKTEAALEVASAGIVNNVCWGVANLAVCAAIAVTAGGGALVPAGTLELTLPAVATAITLLIGVSELLMGWSNAIPLWELDGYVYRQALIREWWGFHDSFDGFRPGSDTNA